MMKLYSTLVAMVTPPTVMEPLVEARTVPAFRVFSTSWARSLRVMASRTPESTSSNKEMSLPLVMVASCQSEPKSC